MKNENYLERKIIAIAAQNVAFWPCRSNKPRTCLVLDVAKFYNELGHMSVVFCSDTFLDSGKAKSIPDDVKKELRKYADIEIVDCGNDSERDDKM